MTNAAGNHRTDDTPDHAAQGKPPTELDDSVGQPLLAAAAIAIGFLGLMFGTEQPTRVAAAVVGFAGAAWLFRVFRARGEARR
ncbi:hypothetical protein BS329_15575 [Amycolatopsis coloradensis]|uniref:Uncharacterized protein n=1 Tax=Amycolatopsis coloradensis TaxID=76021 RepID=A0A1R0KU84_9PSEU|nr:hypothetical protein [Amycolatopsis coloradensis]OLZ51683.1 hypothetical protein BS329_15575 [Amycolatopsis coloradensis]